MESPLSCGGRSTVHHSAYYNVRGTFALTAAFTLLAIAPAWRDRRG